MFLIVLLLGSIPPSCIVPKIDETFFCYNDFILSTAGVYRARLYHDIMWNEIIMPIHRQKSTFDGVTVFVMNEIVAVFSYIGSASHWKIKIPKERDMRDVSDRSIYTGILLILTS